MILTVSMAKVQQQHSKRIIKNTGVMAFEEVVGLPPKIDRKIARRWVHIESQSSIDELPLPNSLTVNELMAARNGHDRRLDAFYSLKENNIIKLGRTMP